MNNSIENTDFKEIVDFALEHDILNLDDVQEQMTKKRRKELLEQHTYKIWQGTDSRYRTYVDDSTKPAGRRMITKTNEEDLLDALIDYYDLHEQEASSKDLTLETLYPQWLDYKALHTNAKNYIRRIDSDWNKYYMNTDIIHIPIKNLNKLTLDTWAHTLIQTYSMTKKQYYNCTIIMRQALDYAVDLGVIKNNPLLEVHIDGKRLFRKVKKKPDHTQVFLTDEILVVYRTAWEHFSSPNKLFHKLSPLAVLFQFQTGVRLGELCALKYSDIESENFIHIQRMFRYETNEVVEHTKTEYSDRNVFLTADAKKYIQIAKEYQKQFDIKTEYIFSTTSEPLASWSVAYLYKKYCEEIGIVKKSSHKSRKTYISALLDGKVNLNTVREMVGHADERTTLGNYCFDRNTEVEKANLIEKALAC